MAVKQRCSITLLVLLTLKIKRKRKFMCIICTELNYLKNYIYFNLLKKKCDYVIFSQYRHPIQDEVYVVYRRFVSYYCFLTADGLFCWYRIIGILHPSPLCVLKFYTCNCFCGGLVLL